MRSRVGFLDNRAAAAHKRQREAIVTEASRARATLSHTADVGQANGAAALASSARVMLGGTHTIDAVQTFAFQTNGWEHHYAQPYSGMQPLPGEHHGLLNGALPAPIAFLRQGGGGRWESPDRTLAAWLSGQFALEPALRALAWDWKSGFTQIDLPWTAQVRSLGNGRSHLVLMAGRYGGFTTYDVGFAAFLGLAGALSSVLGAPQSAQAFLAESAWGSLLAGPPPA